MSQAAEKVINFILVMAFVVGVPLGAFYIATDPKPKVTPPVQQNVVIYEDGSGVQYAPGTDREIRTFPADTFAWDCRTMGNKVCGHTW